MGATPNQDSAETLIYDEALRRHAAQGNRLDLIRRSTVTAMTVGAVVGGITSGRIDFTHLPRPQLVGLSLVAVGLAAAALATIWAHLPKVMATAPALNAWQDMAAAGKPPSVQVYTFNMVREIEKMRRANTVMLDKVVRAQVVAWVALAIQLVGWAVALA